MARQDQWGHYPTSWTNMCIWDPLMAPATSDTALTVSALFSSYCSCLWCGMVDCQVWYDHFMVVITKHLLLELKYVWQQVYVVDGFFLQQEGCICKASSLFSYHMALTRIDPHVWRSTTLNLYIKQADLGALKLYCYLSVIIAMSTNSMYSLLMKHCSEFVMVSCHCHASFIVLTPNCYPSVSLRQVLLFQRL